MQDRYIGNQDLISRGAICFIHSGSLGKTLCVTAQLCSHKEAQILGSLCGEKYGVVTGRASGVKKKIKKIDS